MNKKHSTEENLYSELELKEKKKEQNKCQTSQSVLPRRWLPFINEALLGRGFQDTGYLGKKLTEITKFMGNINGGDHV